MTIDRYTKTVLTVIAACLVWISFGGPSLLTPVAAQSGVTPQEVVIVGWKQNGQGRVLHLPEWRIPVQTAEDRVTGR